MRPAPAQHAPAPQAGFVLIEVLVSALVLIIATAGIITLMRTSVRAQGEERRASQAYALAQEDQARLASTRLATLNHLDETRTVTVDKVDFKVRSTAIFVNNTTSTPSCGEGTVSADYVQISSTVTWAGMSSPEKAKIVSIVSPSNGSLDPNNGSVAISAKTQQQAPLQNVSVSAAGGAFSGFTDAAGCVVFADVPAGDYVVTVSGAPTGLVGKDGNAATQEKLTVVGGDAKTANFEFGVPGTIPVKFKYRVGSTESFVASTAASVVAFNTGMPSAKVIWTPSGNREATVNATSLFPFSSAYTLYAGSCASNHPDPEGKNPGGAPAIGTAVAPAGGTASAVTLQLPAYDPTAWSGKSSSSKGTAFANADVWIRDDACTKESQPVTFRTTTNASGKLTDLGLPFGVYDLCIDTEPGSGTSGVRRDRYSNVSIQSLTSSTTRDFYLGSGSGAEGESGSCP